MMSRRYLNGCSESRLRSYLDDRLAEPEECQLADHLAGCEECRQTLERLAAGSRICAELRGLTTELHALSKATERIAPEFLGPSELPGFLGRMGPYEVAEVLGRGGFGVVLKAHDPALGRTVAVKVLAPQLAASAAARSRFAREAKAAAAVVHENVVAIHAVDSWNGLPYLVMACVAGRSLQERVDREGPLAVKEVLRIGMQTALGLAAAHDQGLVHRDIKPSNILLENGVERVKLSDFGLARAVDDASQTQSGVIAGTPQYMSPEQARGEPVDHRSDVFSLGGVMYFMCAGRPPFRADSTPAVLRRVCDDQPRRLREINPDVPEWLAEVIDRLLVRDAAGRYATATEVAEVLKHHLANLQRTGTSAPLHRAALVPAGGKGRPVTKPKTKTSTAALLLLTSVAAVGLARVWWAGNRDFSTPSFAGANAPSDSSIVGSGRPASKTLALAGFEHLDVTHPFLVDVTRADQFGVSVTADDNVLEHVKAVKEGSSLKVALEEGKRYRVKAGSLKLTVAMPALAGLGLSHGARATIGGFRSDRVFQARLSHGATLQGEIEGGNMTLAATHGSTLGLKGKGGDATLVANHGSKLMLTELAVRVAEVDVAHGSIARFDARTSQRVKIGAAHGGDVIGSVEAGDVAVEAEHGSTVSLRGHALRADLGASHASRLALAGLAVDTANARLEHSSSATVNVKEAIDYQIGRGSSLRYVGSPKVGRSESSGLSTAKSITADEAAKEAPVTWEDHPKPATHDQGDLFISTVPGDSGVNQFGGPSGALVVGSGRPASKTWDVADFNAIAIGSTFRAEITWGDTFKVTTSSDDNVVEHLSVVKEGKTLRVDLARGGNYGLVEPLTVAITLPSLEGLEVGGASRATLKGFRSNRDFLLKLDGASKVEGSLDAANVDIHASGACELTLAGSARFARLSASGASHLKLADFPVGRCEVGLSGASHARLAARSTEPFKATASGACTLVGSVEAAEVSIKLDGRSTTDLRGKAEMAVLEADGASRLGLDGLAVGEAKVKLTGSSRGSVDARKSLTYVLSSSSQLDYAGNPPVLTGTKAKHATLRQRP
jgi:eukaryotic-like serine/threonine-protein kinase